MVEGAFTVAMLLLEDGARPPAIPGRLLAAS